MPRALETTWNYHSYILVGIICALCAGVFLLQLSRSLVTKSQATFLRGLMISYIGYCLANVVWGFGEGGLLPWGVWANKIDNFVSYASFNLLVYFWCLFICESYIPLALDHTWSRFVISLPMLVVGTLDFVSMWTGWIFAFDADGIYQIGNLFYLAMALDALYVIVCLGACIYHFFKGSSKRNRRKDIILLCFGPLMILATLLQNTVANGQPVEMGSIIVLASVLVVFLHDERIYSDALTGLNNRRRLDEYVSDLLEQVSEEKTYVLMLFDIDKFKMINDEYGHLIGDKTLQLVAKAFMAAAQETMGFAARYGGDEFVLVYQKKVAQPEAMLAQVNAKIAKLVEESKEIDFPITLSAGCAYVSDPKERLEDVLGRADQELYQAKQRLFAKK